MRIIKYLRLALIMKMFTLSAMCNVLRDKILNINLLFEAFGIFTIPNAIPSVFQKICRNLDT